MHDLQKFIDTMSKQAQQERSTYHATFGDLIDKLKNADPSSGLSPEITGVAAYRGYYSDIALTYDDEIGGIYVYNAYDDYDSLEQIEFSQNPQRLAEILESLIGKYFDGYKGGFNEVTRDKPLWVANDKGDCSGKAVVDISDDLRLTIKIIE